MRFTLGSSLALCVLALSAPTALAKPTPSKTGPEPSLRGERSTDERMLIESFRSWAAGEARAEAAGEAEPPTDNEQLKRFLVEVIGPSFSGEDGRWQFQVLGVDIWIVSDQRADRMRIMAPVADASELDAAALRTLLEADFDRALDAKYAIWNDAVWSVYVHPLSSLTRGEFRSALAQVFTLTQTFGTTFTSTEFVFGEDCRPPVSVP